ncbi:hypothetical protein MBAV_003846 [Candidatus Magnetobacterium bavaricum]|uniref:Uncharacterized protein n=1 Tax=Candidatus Magnetobacterium bavaricum TaxID=29290 RepID=A0A0F3GPV4_9BACT|nr:hypothetical protein MBAV_003846 [Candidatus Magnetobacterium bavaricum]
MALGITTSNRTRSIDDLFSSNLLIASIPSMASITLYPASFSNIRILFRISSLSSTKSMVSLPPTVLGLKL